MERRRGSALRHLLVVMLLALAMLGMPALAADWRTASREPVGLAPDPMQVREAMVQIYAARTWGWRGRFAVHTWIALKPLEASAWTVHEVIGWRKYRNQPPLVVHGRPADGRWFGAAPELLFEKRGKEAEALINRIEEASQRYPYAQQYLMWPGPNSNTFVAWVLRQVPEIDCDLPPTAIGKDYLGATLIARAPSGTGFQVSLWGLLGIMVGEREGFEANVLGLVFGIHPGAQILKVPMAGRVKMPWR